MTGLSGQTVMLRLDLEKDPFGWMMWSVMGMRAGSTTVHSRDGESITVTTGRMLEWFATVRLMLCVCE